MYNLDKNHELWNKYIIVAPNGLKIALPDELKSTSNPCDFNFNKSDAKEIFEKLLQDENFQDEKIDSKDLVNDHDYLYALRDLILKKGGYLTTPFTKDVHQFIMFRRLRGNEEVDSPFKSGPCKDKFMASKLKMLYGQNNHKLFILSPYNENKLETKISFEDITMLRICTWLPERDESNDYEYYRFGSWEPKGDNIEPGDNNMKPGDHDMEKGDHDIEPAAQDGVNFDSAGL